MGFWKGRGRKDPPASTPPPAEEVGGRRDFFRLGLGRAKDGGLDALRAVGKATRAMQEALDGLDEEVSAQTLAARRADTSPTPQAQQILAQAELRRARGPIAPPPVAARGVVRPPGAVPEDRFLTLCDGCRKCLDACPEGAIQAAVDPRRAGRAGTPLLRVQSTVCALCPEVPCASACPTGALLPVARPQDIRIGTATLYPSLCLNSLGESCEVCIDHCPLGAAVMTRDDSGFPRIDAATCTGCGQCVVRCPTYPVALHVVPR